MKPLIAAATLTLTGYACVPVGPQPIIPSATLVDTCTYSAAYAVRYTYTVHGSGWWWGHAASGDGLVQHLRDGSQLVFTAIGETWVMFATDPDDNGTTGIAVPGGHLPAIWPVNDECP